VPYLHSSDRVSAVEKAIGSSARIAEGDKKSAYESYLTSAAGKSNTGARAIAQDIVGEPVFWDWDRAHRFPAPHARAL
jgi:hypothetical protein